MLFKMGKWKKKCVCVSVCDFTTKIHLYSTSLGGARWLKDEFLQKMSFLGLPKVLGGFEILATSSWRCFLNVWVFPKIVVPPNHPFLIGCSIINHPFWDTPIFGNTQLFHMSNFFQNPCGHFNAFWNNNIALAGGFGHCWTSWNDNLWVERLQEVPWQF